MFFHLVLGAFGSQPIVVTKFGLGHFLTKGTPFEPLAQNLLILGFDCDSFELTKQPCPGTEKDRFLQP